MTYMMIVRRKDEMKKTPKKLFKAKAKDLGWFFTDYTKDGVFVVYYADKANSSVMLIPGTGN